MKNAIPLALIVLSLIAAHPRAQLTPPHAPMTPSEVKAAFIKLLDRPKVPLDVTTRETKTGNRGVISEKIDFATEARPDGTFERVPALVVRPEGTKPGEKMPAVLVLHGTGGRKEGLWPWLEQLAHRGFVAIAIDGRYHGERAEGEKGTRAYNEAIYKAYRSKAEEAQAHPFYYDTCWDAWRTIDYLQTRADVDADRIGMIGISKGGIETWLAASVDDRVKVAVPAIAVQSFRWGLEHDRWQARANTIKEAHEAVANELSETQVNARVCRALWSKVIPGIVDDFDGPSMIRLFAGRSLLILNGERDPNCPIEGAEIAFSAARAAFHDIDADSHLKILVAPGAGHTVTREQHEAALDWFAVWLKPTAPSGAAKFLNRRALANAPKPAAVVAGGQPRPEHPRPHRRPFGQKPKAPTAPVTPATLTIAPAATH